MKAKLPVKEGRADRKGSLVVGWDHVTSAMWAKALSITLYPFDMATSNVPDSVCSISLDPSVITVFGSPHILFKNKQKQMKKKPMSF